MTIEPTGYSLPPPRAMLRCYPRPATGDGMGNSAPPGRHTIIPRIIVDDPQAVVEFLHDVFGGDGEYQPTRPSEVLIGDSLVMVSDGGGIREPMPSFLYVYVEDLDAVFARAADAGVEVVEAPQVMPYGDVRATVRDQWGNLWQIAQAGEP